MKSELLADLMAMLFPCHCALCGDAVPRGVLLCEGCKREDAAELACTVLPIQMGRPVRCVTPYCYEGRVKGSLHRFKFQGCKEYADFYADRIAAAWRESIPFHLVTAVPISRARRRERGYNQSELIGRAVAESLKISYQECLKKIKENKIQHDLSGEERKKNVEGVYAALERQTIEGKRILLIDDIVTTGSTLGECCSVLYQAGASEVCCAAAARVPLHN